MGHLRGMCYMGQALCQQQIHPSRASMHLDIPLESKTINEIKEDLMKVHVYYLEASSNTDVIPQKISSNGFGESSKNQNGTINGKDEPMDTDISNTINKDSVTTDTTSQVSATVLTNIPKEKESSGQSSTPKVEEPLEEMSTREENARIAKEAYHFEENPIFIPENL